MRIMRIMPSGDGSIRPGSDWPTKSVEVAEPAPIESRPMPTGTETRPAPTGQTERAEVDKLAEKMNSAANIFNKAVQFKVLEGNRLVVKVIDTSSGEVLREVPPEKLVEAFRSLQEHLGILFDRKV